jgi:ATP-dependent RNA helicase RhlE
VESLKFEQTTSIQKDAIPPAMQGRDVLACAMTGSGKTAAFGLPILNTLLSKPRGTTRALILTPTRELALQITEHLQELSRYTKLTCASVFGGVGMGPQRKAFEKGADIIVATPGRLLDHFQYSYGKLQNLEILVIDEADRMLDMGFLPDIQRIIKHVKKPQQTLFFSATMPKEIQRLANQMLKDPFTINLERKAAPATGVTQVAYPIRQDLKSELLVELLRDENLRSVVVFTRTKRRADRVADFVHRQGVRCTKIHGDRTQSQRTQALEQFKIGRYRVLVATDVAARGIDVDSLSHVVNFDVPNVAEDYIHRVGRTARASAKGDAFTFVSPEEENDFRAIERALDKRLPRLTVEGFDYNRPRPPQSARPHGQGGGGYQGNRGGGRGQGGNGNSRWRSEQKPAHRGPVLAGHGNSAGESGGGNNRSGNHRQWENRGWKSGSEHRREMGNRSRGSRPSGIAR